MVHPSQQFLVLCAACTLTGCAINVDQMHFCNGIVTAGDALQFLLYHSSRQFRHWSLQGRYAHRRQSRRFPRIQYYVVEAHAAIAVRRSLEILSQ